MPGPGTRASKRGSWSGGGRSRCRMMARALILQARSCTPVIMGCWVCANERTWSGEACRSAVHREQEPPCASVSRLPHQSIQPSRPRRRASLLRACRSKRMPEKIRVVIADDHPVVRTGLRMMLGMEEGIELVGEAADGVAAIHLVSELQPDVVLMDLRMPALSGLEAIERIRTEWPHIAIIV